ncbi:MAG: hypothetical protein U5N27_04355 [Rhizobium sp.]|nr:hypothetical protein [Rhizobium sp.]
MLQEIVTIGLSEAGDAKLNELKEEGVFAEKMDGFRFAVALALSRERARRDFKKVAVRKPWFTGP